MKKLLLLAVIPLMMVGCKKDKGNPTIANTHWTWDGSYAGNVKSSTLSFYESGNGFIVETTHVWRDEFTSSDFTWNESYDDRTSYLNVTITFTDKDGNLITRKGGVYKDKLEIEGVSYNKD